MWAEGRMHGEYDAIETPVGFLPKYEDLKALFKKIFDRDYTRAEYIEQFSLRTDKLLEKLDRMEPMLKEEDVSQFLFEILEKQRQNLKKLKEKHGKAVVSPLEV